MNQYTGHLIDDLTKIVDRVTRRCRCLHSDTAICQKCGATYCTFCSTSRDFNSFCGECEL